MSIERPFLTADAARAQVGVELDAIVVALHRLRTTSTTWWATPFAWTWLSDSKAMPSGDGIVLGAESAVIDAATDTRTASQRLHDALAWWLRTGIESGSLAPTAASR